jgi:hypothetical protein
MIIDVRLSETEQHLIPDFNKRFKRFQSSVDKWTKSRREIFRLCIHEGGHVWAYRKFNVTVSRFDGPNVSWKYDKPLFARGSITRGDVSSLPGWMNAAADVAGYLAVEILTGAPEGPDTIENDNRGHEKADLGAGEIFIRSELRESLNELISAAREYEFRVFGTDEVVLWGVNEFRVFLPGERYQVGLSFTGGLGVLIEHKGALRLYVDGIEYTPADKIDDCDPTLVVPYGAKREGVDEVVKLWNNVVAVSYIITG